MLARSCRCLFVCFLIYLSAAAATPSSIFADEPRDPAAFLGRPVGTDFQLADWTQVSGYYTELASRSPHVRVQSAGKTTEQRDLLYAVISSEDNLARLDELKTFARCIAQPQTCSPEELQTAIMQGRPFLMVTPSMHSDEPASTEMGMQLAWQLAHSTAAPWPQIREQVVVILLPSLNPDGVDHVVQWYREHVGTPQEGSSMLKLYQHYTGHDNNRDWFSLTQQETKLLTRLLYHEWFPQVLWDVHQYGSQKERFFVPPYRDPLNPNLDPGIVAGINALGNRAVLDMTQAGLTGIASGVSYDNWWNGGNRSVPCRHNIIGLLTEAAPVNIASPIFVKHSQLKDPLGRTEYRNSNQFITPWPGGWWRLSDIHAYQLAFGESILSSLAREPQLWLNNAAAAAQRSIAAGDNGSPTGWILPLGQHDQTTLTRFVKLLLDSGVEVHTLAAETTLAGHTYPAGSVVIRRGQPYGNYVKDLVEYKMFPAGERPYDVAGWSLGALFGLKIVEVREPLPQQLTRATSVEIALAEYGPDPRLQQAPAGSLSTQDLASWTKLAEQLAQGKSHVFLRSGASAGLLVPETALPRGVSPEQGQVISQMPRIGVYASWIASMDEGWLRWMLDDAAISFTKVRNETIRAGGLRNLFDVLIIPDLTSGTLNQGRDSEQPELPYAGGLSGPGLLALEEFVRDGGKLIAFDTSAHWLIDQWKLPVTEVTTSKAGKEFQCSGSVVRSQPQWSHLTVGLPRDLPLMFSHSKVWEPGKPSGEQSAAGFGEFHSHLNFPTTHLLLSGHMENPDAIAGKSAWCSGSFGTGTIHLFGFRPHYRGWSQGAFGLLYRAIFLEP